MSYNSIADFSVPVAFVFDRDASSMPFGTQQLQITWFFCFFFFLQGALFPLSCYLAMPFACFHHLIHSSRRHCISKPLQGCACFLEASNTASSRQ